MDQKAAEEDEEASVLPRRKNFRARRAGGKTADRSGLKTQGAPDTGEVNESIEEDNKPQGQHKYEGRRFRIRK